MIKIRTGVFETNSSNTHALAIMKNSSYESPFYKRFDDDLNDFDNKLEDWNYGYVVTDEDEAKEIISELMDMFGIDNRVYRRCSCDD